MRNVREKGQPGEVRVWAETSRYHPRLRYVVDKATGGGDPGRRVQSFDEAVREIGRVVREVAAQGGHVRAQGARWSFSKVAATADAMLDTHRQLGQVIDVSGPYPEADVGPLSRALRPELQLPDGRAYVFCEGGAKIDDLMGALDGLGLSVETAGSSSGQSIAGVIATGTHGADFDMPPIADFVRALVLVGPDGQARWLESASDPLTNAGASVQQELLPCVHEVLRDDDAFEAALVSIGSLGVVAGLVLQVREEYGLWEQVERSEEGGPTVTWEGVRDAICDGTIFDDPGGAGGGTYRTLEVLVNPHPRDDGTHFAHLVRRYEHAVFTHEAFDRDSVPIFTILATLAGNDPKKFRETTEKLLRAGREDSREAFSAHDIINYGSSRIEKTWSTEVCLSTEDGAHTDFIDAALALFDARIANGQLMAGFLAIRFTRGSRAPLAMQTGSTGSGGRYCHVELHVLQGLFRNGLFDETDPAKLGELFFADFLELAEEERATGRLRFHWGQMVPRPTALAVSASTHPRIEAWNAGRDRLLGDRPYVFANELSVRAGLLPCPAGFALDTVLGSGPGHRLPPETRGRLAATPVVVAPAASGRAEVIYACNAHGWIACRGANDAGWASVGALDAGLDADDAPAGVLSAATRADGRAVLAARDAAGRLRVRGAAADGTWGVWEGVDDDLQSDPVLLRDGNGKLQIFAVRTRGAIHRWRELGTGWEHLAGSDRFAKPDGLDVLETPAVGLGPSGAIHVVARVSDGRLLRSRADAPLTWHPVVASEGPPSVTATASGAPTLAIDGAELLVAAPLENGALWARRFDAAWSGLGPSSVTQESPGVLPRTRLAARPTAAGYAVVFTDLLRRARLYEVTDGAWPGFGRAYEVEAVSAPALVGDTLVVKVAHDIVVKRNVL